MIIRTIAVYDKFRCVGGYCRDTCCIRDKLVLDNKTYFEYQRVIAKGDAFGRRMVACISERNGVASFRMRENGECPFLMRNHLCELQIRLGTDKVCQTCRDYPTFKKEYGNYCEVGCSFTCPEILRLILTHPQKFVIRSRENDTVPVSLAHLNADFLSGLYPVRDYFLSLVQDPRLSLGQTTARLIDRAAKAQEIVKRKEYARLPELVAPYADGNELPPAPSEPFDPATRRKLICSVLKLHEKMEYRRPENLERIKGVEKELFARGAAEKHLADERAFIHFMEERKYEYQKWLFYLLHRYLLDAVFDRRLLARVKFAVVSALLLFEEGLAVWIGKKDFTPLDQENLFRNYAREIEENPRNLSRILRRLGGRAFSVQRLLRTLPFTEENAKEETENAEKE